MNNTLPTVFEIENLLTVTECDQLLSIMQQWPIKSFVPNAGRFKEQLVANQAWHNWSDSDKLSALLKPHLDSIYGSYHVAEAVYQELILPWDVHCDYDRPGRVTTPWYAILIPLEDSASRTIIFNQTAEYNDFWKYKQLNQPIDNPVDLEFWQENLNHCWDDDRNYLSVQHVSKPWKRGNVLSLQRNVLHTSDNFHQKNIKPKKFLQILLDK